MFDSQLSDAPSKTGGYKAPTAANPSKQTVSHDSTQAKPKALTVGNQHVERALKQVASATPAATPVKAQNSAVLDREIASQSGAVDRDITSLFFGLKDEIRQQVVSYGIRGKTLRFTLLLKQGVIDSVTVSGVPDELERALNALLVGRRVSTGYTGVKSHVVMVN
ncbi:hypothetical protein BS049_RS23350 [Vibrio parahaemolyticus]|nr:hypothetical protein [Vibrio parahaemolyticus]